MFWYQWPPRLYNNRLTFYCSDSIELIVCAMLGLHFNVLISMVISFELYKVCILMFWYQ